MHGKRLTNSSLTGADGPGYLFRAAQAAGVSSGIL
jgi:hypothetical protein